MKFEAVRINRHLIAENDELRARTQGPAHEEAEDNKVSTPLASP